MRRSGSPSRTIYQAHAIDWDGRTRSARLRLDQAGSTCGTDEAPRTASFDKSSPPARSGSVLIDRSSKTTCRTITAQLKEVWFKKQLGICDTAVTHKLRRRAGGGRGGTGGKRA